MVTAARIAPWQAAGLAVNAWTVNDAMRAQELDALGVDGIITDTPATVLAALAR
jgi:glycerophosphoryl diester phosphodiesterase